MAGKTITQRIALEGGEAILEALKALGVAGEKAFEQIRQAAEGVTRAKPLENLALTAEILKERLEALGEAGRRVAAAGVAFGRAWRGLEGNIKKLARNVTLLTTALVGAAAGFIAFIKAGADAVDEAQKQARAIGLTIEEYGRLKFAAEQGGVGAESLRTAITRLNVALGKLQDDVGESADEMSAFERLGAQSGVTVRRFGTEAEETGKKTLTAATAFTELGINVKDANGELRPTTDILADLADAFAGMQDGPREAALLVALFGRAAGPELALLLNEGGDALRENMERFDELTGGLSSGAAKIGDAFGDAFNEVGTALTAVRNNISLAFAPGLTEIATAIADFIAETRPALEAFATDLAGRVVPVIRDLFNALIGNDAAVVDRRILEWREAILSFGRGVQEVVTSIVIPAFNTLLSIFDAIAGGLNAVFGTEFTGGALLAAAAVAQFLGVFAVLGSAVSTVVAGINLLVAGFGLIGPALLVASGFFSLLVEGMIAFGLAVASVIGWPALIVAGVVAATAAIVIFWDEIVAAAQATWDFIAGLFTAAGFTALWDGLVGAAQAAWEGVLSIAQASLDGLSTILGGLGPIAEAAWGGFLTAAQFVWDGITGIFNAGAATVQAIWQGIADTVMQIWTGATDTVAAAAQTILDAINKASETAADVEGAARIAEGLSAPFLEAQAVIENVFNAITALVERGFEAAVSAGDTAIEGIGRVAREITGRLRRELDQMVASLNAALSRILAAINSAISRLRAAAAEARAAGSGGGGGEGLRAGGFVWGPGTPTSDSIPAMLSRGEFVVNARAVKKLGLAFMRAVNSGRVAGRQLAAAVPRFKDGGLVGQLGDIDLSGVIRMLGEGIIPAPQLALAGVGEITAQRPQRAVNLYLPGVDQPLRVTTDEDVFGKLSSFLGKSGMRQAGRSPGWR